MVTAGICIFFFFHFLFIIRLHQLSYSIETDTTIQNLLPDSILKENRDLKLNFKHTYLGLIFVWFLLISFINNVIVLKG